MQLYVFLLIMFIDGVSRDTVSESLLRLDANNATAGRGEAGVIHPTKPVQRS